MKQKKELFAVLLSAAALTLAAADAGLGKRLVKEKKRQEIKKFFYGLKNDFSEADQE